MAPKQKPLTVGKGTSYTRPITPGRNPRPVSAKPSEASKVRAANKTTSSGITRRPDGRPQTEGRGARQATSTARVTKSGGGTPGSAKVTTGQVRAAAKRGQEIRKAAQAARGAKQAMGRMGSTLARARFARGPASAIAGAVADQALSPLATKAGQALGRALKPAARKLDDTLPGINSRDEARRRNAQAAAKGSTSRFKGAREAAVKKASAIKGSPVAGPPSGGGGASSFDSSFAAARKAGKSTFTWRGKKYNTKLKGK